MADKAKVTSVDALDAFRAHLLVYLDKTTVAVEDAMDDVVRTRRWLETDQRRHWEGLLRQRRKTLEYAEQELFSARIANLKEPTTLKNMAMLRAKRAVVEAEDKMRGIRKWEREFDPAVMPLVKPLEALREVLTKDLRKAADSLGESIKLLESYAEMAPRENTSQSPEPGDTPSVS